VTKSKLFIVVAIFFGFAFTYWQDQNSPPKVTISVQAEGSTFQWNTIVPYTITVSDVEDGNTEYNEIQSNEVLLLARYFSDSTLIKNNTISEQMVHHDAVLAMSKALCFNCHAAKANLIGPSFDQVAVRYKNADGAIDRLTKKIIDGSTGTWSDLRMPPHPNLEVQHVREMVRWILRNNSDPDFIYFVGTEGAFKTKNKPANASGTGVYLLTASYMDHGLRNPINEVDAVGKRGQQILVLKNRE
jgi:cytochrome c